MKSGTETMNNCSFGIQDIWVKQTNGLIQRKTLSYFYALCVHFGNCVGMQMIKVQQKCNKFNTG